jgi:hypothetical protein
MALRAKTKSLEISYWRFHLLEKIEGKWKESGDGKCGDRRDVPRFLRGGWPRFAPSCITTKPAAPGFGVFEAWAFLVLASRDFPDPQLGLLHFAAAASSSARY